MLVNGQSIIGRALVWAIHIKRNILKLQQLRCLFYKPNSLAIPKAQRLSRLAVKRKLSKDELSRETRIKYYRRRFEQDNAKFVQLLEELIK